MKKHFKWSHLLIFLPLVTILSGCAECEDAVLRAAREGVFLINNGAEPRDLDPHVVTGMPENRVIKSLLEGLVTEHPESSEKVSPGMAERWESNEDKSIWTFQLRKASWWLFPRCRRRRCPRRRRFRRR